MTRRNGSSRPGQTTLYRLLTILILGSLLGSSIPPPPGVGAAPVGAVTAATVSSGDLRALPEAQESLAWQQATNAAPDRPVTVGRSEFGRTELNPDGTMTAVISERPMYWRDPASGEWRDFVDTLRPSTAGDAAYENTSNAFKAAFARASDVAAGRPLMRFSHGGGAVSVTPVGAAPTGATAQGARIVYKDAYPGVDAEYEIDRELAKETLVLTSAASVSTFTFDLAMEGVSPTRRADGSVAFTDGANKLLFEMPRPFMVDANGALSEAISVTLTTPVAGGARLALAPDTAWLRDPARAFPVRLDPTLKVPALGPRGAAGRNTWIDQLNPTVNHNGEGSLLVNKHSTGERQDTLIKFATLDAIPADSTVIGATMRLYARGGSAGMPVQAHRATGDWDTATVNWNTAPAFTTFVWDTANTTVGAWNSFDVTGLVRGWVTGLYPNYGARLRSNGANGQWVAYHSSYYSDAGCSGCDPELRIRYLTASRYGLNKLWTHTGHGHGGGTSSSVNTSTGNLVLRHHVDSIPARGFSVDLTFTYNSQDDYGLDSGYIGSGGAAVYGEAWTFSGSARLYEVDGGNAVVYKDPTGNATRIYVKSADSNGQRTYERPLHYDYTLTKDIGVPPADASKVFKLGLDSGRIRHYFDAAGKRTRVEDDNGNSLRYGYDASGRLETITDVANRVTRLEYLAPNGRLSKITDMAGRSHEFGYTAGGNLSLVKRAAGTLDETVTRFGYDASNGLVSVTNPRGKTSSIKYKTWYDWETAGSTQSWVAINSSTAIAQSTEQAHSGAGALRLDITNVSSTQNAGAQRVFSPPTPLGSVAQELVAWVYAPAGTALEGALFLKHRDGYDSGRQYVNLVGGQWNPLRFEDAEVDPGMDVSELEVLIRPRGAAGVHRTGVAGPRVPQGHGRVRHGREGGAEHAREVQL